VQIIHARLHELFFYINADTCELDFRHLCATALESGGSWFWEGLQKKYIFLVLYGQYWWWGGEVCSNVHGAGERECYRCTWSVLTVNSVMMYCAPLRWRW
jgi:hypothetical protein